jgi:hypothetical protein
MGRSCGKTRQKKKPIIEEILNHALKNRDGGSDGEVSRPLA